MVEDDEDRPWKVIGEFGSTRITQVLILSCSTLHGLKIQFPPVSTYRGGIPRILQRMYICRRVITFLLNFPRYKYRLARHLLLESACEYEEA